MPQQISSAGEVINGLYGELWVDGVKKAEIDKFQVVIKKNASTILFCGHPVEDTKMTSVANSGSMEGYHLDSWLAEEIETTQQGRDLRHTIRGKLADPDVLKYGHEAVEILNVTFSQLTAMDWQAGQPGRISIPFTCGKVKFTDKIPVR